MTIETDIPTTTTSRKAKVQARLSTNIHSNFSQLIRVLKIPTSLSSKTIQIHKSENTSNNGIRLIESTPLTFTSMSYTIDINLRSNSVKFSISPVSSANSLTIFHYSHYEIFTNIICFYRSSI